MWNGWRGLVSNGSYNKYQVCAARKERFKKITIRWNQALEKSSIPQVSSVFISSAYSICQK